MPRYFTLEQAQALLPALEEELRRAVSLKSDFEEAERDFRATTARIQLLGGVVVEREKMLALRGRRDALANGLKEALEAVQSRGCLLKDLDLGLVDFPTRFRGREVYLCWKLGEAKIEFWHSVDEGYRGRKPIDRDFLEHHKDR